MPDQEFAHKIFDRGESIFCEGDQPKFAYVIEEGSVDIIFCVNGRDVVADTLKVGEVFGEMALIDNQRRSAKAVAASPTICLLIGKTDFEQWLKNSDAMTQSMLKLLTKRLRKATLTPVS